MTIDTKTFSPVLSIFIVHNLNYLRLKYNFHILLNNRKEVDIFLLINLSKCLILDK